VSFPIGLVIVDLTSSRSEREVKNLTKSAMVSVPPGRCIVILWKPRVTWGSQIPYDAVIAQAVLGDQLNRESREFEFFGNGSTRGYSKSKSGLRYSGCLHWLIFRRVGPRAYSRCATISDEVRSRSELPVLHKVFTRDVANNVWHLRWRNAKSHTIRRLQGLLAWSDETLLLVEVRRKTRRRIATVDLDQNLVGVATKEFYERDKALGVVLL